MQHSTGHDMRGMDASANDGYSSPTVTMLGAFALPQVISADLEKKHADLLASYASDLKDVSDIFHAYQHRWV